MSQQSNKGNVRVEPRFRVRESVNVSATLRTKQNEDDEIRGQLLDLSRGGVRLKTDKVLSKNDTVHLKLTADEVDFEFDTHARVCWVESDIRSGWVVGCALEDRLDDSKISQLAAEGALERRADSRRPISFFAEAKTELATTFSPVEVVNLSAGGFCVTTREVGAKLDDRMLLRVVDRPGGATKLVKARVAWIDDADGRQTIGCTFLSRDGQAQLQAIVDEKPLGNPLFRMIALRPETRWSIVAGAVAIILLIQFFW